MAKKVINLLRGRHQEDLRAVATLLHHSTSPVTNEDAGAMELRGSAVEHASLAQCGRRCGRQLRQVVAALWMVAMAAAAQGKMTGFLSAMQPDREEAGNRKKIHSDR
ncbi:hypothetical protein EJB05_05782, partial [Eragrostis curvula]